MQLRACFRPTRCRWQHIHHCFCTGLATKQHVHCPLSKAMPCVARWRRVEQLTSGHVVCFLAAQRRTLHM